MSARFALRITAMAALLVSALATPSASYAETFDDGGCQNGGPGASSCSVGIPPFHTSCSVTCQSGYFACCTFAGCSCQQPS
jgi:hypothetical protein